MSLRSAVTCEGTFDVIAAQWESVENHCGIDAATVRFKVVVCGELDARGFVIDVRDPRDYFHTVYTANRAPLVSCEAIAERAARFFVSCARGPQRIDVEIQASTYGFATATWTRD